MVERAPHKPSPPYFQPQPTYHPPQPYDQQPPRPPYAQYQPPQGLNVNAYIPSPNQGPEKNMQGMFLQLMQAVGKIGVDMEKMNGRMDSMNERIDSMG